MTKACTYKANARILVSCFLLQQPSPKEHLEFSCIFRTYRRRAVIWYTISIYLKSIKFLISAWIKLARNAFEDMAIFNGYPVVCKWEGVMPPKCKKCT